MIGRIAFYVLLVPLAILLVMFALANKGEVRISFDPFTTDVPAFAVSVKLFWVMLFTFGAGVIVGGGAVWLRQGRWRRTARRVEGDLRRVRREADELRHRLDTPPPVVATSVAVAYRRSPAA